MATIVYPNAEQMFQMQYESVRRDEVVGVLLALLLGCFGVHHFYLGRTGLGILYLCFFWTGIPAILGFIECFFMPGRVRAYNAVQATAIAVALGIAIPAYVAYPGWPAPGFTGAAYTQAGYAGVSHAGVSYAQPDAAGYAPVFRGSQAAAVSAAETTLVVCAQCRMTNAVGARFCSGCGSSLS